jgi:hypothetical protein
MWHLRHSGSTEALDSVFLRLLHNLRAWGSQSERLGRALGGVRFVIVSIIPQPFLTADYHDSLAPNTDDIRPKSSLQGALFSSYHKSYIYP